MNNRFLSICLLAALAVSCIQEQQEVVQTRMNNPVFVATIEDAGDPATRVYADPQRRVLWNADDRISIFNKRTLNRQYSFAGENGANAGSFTPVPSEDFVMSDPVGYVYAVYPYMETTSITTDGVLTVYLPSEQTYRENSFGRGANTMIAVTDDDELMFKNLCGYFALRLYGDDAAVTSITLRGNQNEFLAGKAAITASTDAMPALTLDEEAATNVITLTCPTPVTLGTTPETATTFWFVIPPTTFAGGISFKVSFDSGLMFEKTADNSLTIQRNTLKRASALQVVPGYPTPEVIDLGLSVKWASFNLGADAPEGYGECFAWGETKPYYETGYAQSDSPVWKDGKSAGYDWTSYRWCMGSDHTLTKYCPDASYGNDGFTDDKTVLDPEDDAAHVMLGGGWRMPTVNEEIELINNCTSEWTTVNGVYGRRFTSNRDGFTDRSIFLPTAGFRNALSLTYLGSRGYYWSSSSNPTMPDRAHDLYFASDFVRWGSNGGPRSQGRSVRPVVDNPGYVAVTSVTLSTDALNLNVGQTATLASTVLPAEANNKSLTWTSSDESVATVDQNGLVTAVAKGMAMITAAANDCSGHLAACAVTVKQPVTSISLNKTTLSLYVGQTETLTATVSPSTASNTGVTWSSSDTEVATVSSSGVVTGVAAGTAKVTATAKDGSGVSKQCSITVTAATNLSSSATANCYIVSKAGAYKFKTVKGNSSTSVGTVSSAIVLWESFGTATKPSKGAIITNVAYSGSYISFSTPSTLKNGNAVIAAKNSSGKILWSWHIWVCSGYNPTSTAQTYYNNAGIMMDRNLGATSATPGNIGALGLLYQWGRKDPFLGRGSFSSSATAASTLNWPAAVASNSSRGTIAFAQANPTTFIIQDSNGDWYYTGSYSTTDNTRWKSSKTIYDPCPSGWRVPDGSIWATASKQSPSFDYTYDSTNHGMNLKGKFGSANPIWYPGTLCISGYNGTLPSGDSNSMWSCTPEGVRAEGLSISSGYGRVHTYYSSSRANGWSVRCVKE